MHGALKRIAGRLISTETYERLVASAALEHQFRDLWSTNKFPSRELLWEHCIRKIGSQRRMIILEFGVWKGYSARFFLDRFQHPETRYCGFDSFEGLPDAWGTFPKGMFDTGGAAPQIADPRATFVKGWFQNSFDAGVTLAKESIPRPDAVFIHFDADLYSSTMFLLSRLHNEFDDYYFLFDEFAGHESRALLNFQQAYGAKIEFLAYAGADYPGQVFGRLENMKGRYQPQE